jgi:hypothetical protein
MYITKETAFFSVFYFYFPSDIDCTASAVKTQFEALLELAEILEDVYCLMNKESGIINCWIAQFC